MRNPILAVTVLSALVACAKSGDAPASASSLAAQDITAASPIEKRYQSKNPGEIDVEALFAHFPPYLRPRYQAAAFDEKTGATVVTMLEFGDGRDGFTVERAEFYDVDLVALERISDLAEAATDAPMLPIIGKLRAFGIKDASEGDASPAVKIDALEIDTLRVREGGLPQAGSSSGLAVLFNAFEVAGVYAKGVNYSHEGKGASPSSGVSWSAADIRLIGVGGGRMAALLGRNIVFGATPLKRSLEEAVPGADPLANGLLSKILDAEGQTTKIKTVEWRNVDCSQLLEWGLKGERPPTSERKLIDLGTARLKDIETFIGDRRASLTPETDISAMEFAWLAPSKVRIVSRGATHDFSAYLAPEEDDALGVIKNRRLEAVTVDSNIAYDWHPDRGTAALSISIDAAGLADFDFNLALDDLNIEKIEAARAAGVAHPARANGRLESMSISLKDEELLNVFFDLSALESGGTAKDVRVAAPAMLRLTQREFARNNERVANYVDAIADFIEEGGTLEIVAAPSEPVPLAALERSALAEAGDVAEALNLSVTHRK